MKVLKPLSLGVMTRPFEARDARHLAVHVLAMFPLVGEERLFGEQEMWRVIPEALDEPIVEEGIPKSRAEVLLAGRAFPPERPAATCPIEVELGAIVKRASVIGDRVWRNDVPTEPEPFESMELTWGRAFGGEGFERNPLGRGVAPVEEVEGVPVHRLPNVEHPDRLIRSPQDRPAPVGFGRIDIRWPQRATHRGTYDQRWLETRYPGFAEDLDWRLWNLASEDQQREGAFTGDETFRLVNLHPTRPVIEGTLPSLRARAFLQRAEVGVPDNLRRPDGELEEVETRLMTVWLFPEQERGLLIFSGAAEVGEDDARDVSLLMIAAERLGQPRSLEHYDAVAAKRCDKQMATIEAIMDADLVPEDLVAPLPTSLPGLEPANHFAANQRRGRAKRIAEAGAEAEAAGTSLEELGIEFAEEEEESMPDLRDIPEYLRQKQEELDEMRGKLEERGERMIEEVRALCEARGIDASEILEGHGVTPLGPPRFTADGERERLRDIAARAAAQGSPLPEIEAAVDDEAEYAAWKEQERGLRDLYRENAHFQDPATRRGAEECAALREELLAAAAAGEAIRDRDMTGADLAGIDLRGVDLTGSLLESASLRGAVLEGATLDGVVLAHADVSEARFAGASMRGVNLGRASCAGADLSRTDLTGATLVYTDAAGARFVGATMAETFLLEAVLRGADLSELATKDLFWVQVDLAEARLVHADLTKSTFVECGLAGADLSDATLDEANFVTCALDGASLRRVKGSRARLVHGSSAREADLRHARLPGANLRAVDLEKADLGGAMLDRADLSEARLVEASLFRIRARESMWIRADLRRANLMQADLLDAFLTKADVRGADLREASLFGADLASIHGDSATQLDGSNRERARVRPLRPPS